MSEQNVNIKGFVLTSFAFLNPFPMSGAHAYPPA